MLNEKKDSSWLGVLIGLYTTVDGKAQWLTVGTFGVLFGSILDYIGKAFVNFQNFDYAFIINLIVLVSIDTVFGIYYAIDKKVVSSEGFARLFKKIIMYTLLLVASHAATHYNKGNVIEILSWVDSTIYATIVVRELLSILEKAAKLGYIKLPKSVYEKLEIYHRTEDDESKRLNK